MSNTNRTILVTGGAGFIGSALVRYLLEKTNNKIVNVDKLTYAGNLSSLKTVENHPRYAFVQADICNTKALSYIFAQYQPDAVIHLAAESHVDRSISASLEFIQTNIVGTYKLLESTLDYWHRLDNQKKSSFRFLHISTDEVYGDLKSNEGLFTETSTYKPSSPYSASKAASDHLVQAWYRTYGLPTIITHSSNNYGPYQYPEKLIPLMILNAIEGKTLPIYGDGLQIRDWLFVEDHIAALYSVLTKGNIGETYNIGGNNEKSNIDVVRSICSLVEECLPNKPKHIDKYEDLICYVNDRPGHDIRYALDTSKINNELGWGPKETFESGLRKTVIWYLNHREWCQRVLNNVK